MVCLWLFLFCFQFSHWYVNRCLYHNLNCFILGFVPKIVGIFEVEQWNPILMFFYFKVMNWNDICGRYENSWNNFGLMPYIVFFHTLPKVENSSFWITGQTSGDNHLAVVDRTRFSNLPPNKFCTMHILETKIMNLRKSG